MNPSSLKGATSWLRDVIENSAAVVEVMTPEIQHGLSVARKAIVGSPALDRAARRARGADRRRVAAA
jgi:hypothetical protein